MVLGLIHMADQWVLQVRWVVLDPIHTADQWVVLVIHLVDIWGIWTR